MYKFAVTPAAMPKASERYFATMSSYASLETCTQDPSTPNPIEETDFSRKVAASQFKKPFAMRSLPKPMAKQAPIRKDSAAKPKTKKPPTKTKPSSSSSKEDPKAKICAGLLQLDMLGATQISRLHAATFANYKHVKSTGFVAATKALKNDGLIEYPTATSIRLTAKGKQETPPVDAPKSNADALLRLQKVVELTSDKASPKCQVICQFLSDGKEHSIDAVLKASGYKHAKSTGFATCLSALANLGFVERGNGSIKLADIAFPYGRPGATSVSTSSM
ncbi:hypothetical protein MPSEU_000748900 [Mayamaea pseudoterrestris]|nr:hypothetical protein MPSEU_000748900 [Mayamaea pseudoterrestris]